LLTEPKSFFPSPTLDFIFISKALIFFATLFASSTIFLFLTACCLRFSVNIFLAEDVASIAEPFGIKKFLPKPFLTVMMSSLNPTPSTSFF